MSASDNATPHKAAEYDMAVRQTIPFYEAIQMQVVDIARTVKPNADCWFDTGAGTGYLVELAVPNFRSTSFVLADTSPAMLDRAKRRLADLQPERVRFLPPIGNQDLCAYQGQIHPDIITAVLCNHYLSREGRHTATEARLLPEEGLFITVENITPAAEANVTLGLERWKRFQLEQGRPPSVVDDRAKRFGKEYFPITLGEHYELQRRTGFRNVSLFWLSYMQAGFYAIK